MKKIILGATALLMITTSLVSASIEEQYKEGEIKLQKAGAFDDEKQVIIRIGEKVEFKIKMYESDFIGETIISANANIDNKTDQKVKAVYSVAFFDKDNKLVGCHQGSWDLKPNNDINYGSGMIFTDAESISSVTNYKLRIQVMESKKD